jgi:hypothetical protein
MLAILAMLKMYELQLTIKAFERLICIQGNDVLQSMFSRPLGRVKTEVRRELQALGELDRFGTVVDAHNFVALFPIRKGSAWSTLGGEKRY